MTFVDPNVDYKRCAPTLDFHVPSTASRDLSAPFKRRDQFIIKFLYQLVLEGCLYFICTQLLKEIE